METRSSKRKTVKPPKPISVSVKRPKKSSTALSAYLKSYKNGDEMHLSLFRVVQKLVQPEKVFYPGCHRHITASLTFKDVIYVDFDSKVQNCFEDDSTLQWLNDNKEYDNDCKLKFICGDFTHNLQGVVEESFDLLISACAGIVSTSTSKYLKKGGYYLISDAHYDARMLSLDKEYTLKYVWDSGKKELVNDQYELDQHFRTLDGEKITREMVDESMNKPKARRSFKLKKEAMFYLFQKNH